jgi:hypothetical protein
MGFFPALFPEPMGELPQQQYEKFYDKKSKKLKYHKEIKVTDKLLPIHAGNKKEKLIYEFHASSIVVLLQ